MELGNFKVVIPQGEELENGYVKMVHGQQYTIRMINLGELRSNAYVSVDGLDMGGYRLEPGQTFTLERSSKDQGRFTFFAAGTQQAFVAGEAAVTKQEKGVVQVRFVPERRRQPDYSLSKGMTSKGGTTRGGLYDEEEDVTRGFESYTGTTRGGGMRGFGAGMTGLTGQSSQRFQNASHIDEDESQEVIITLRLVHQKNEDVRPLPGRMANVTPPSVE